MPRGERGIRDMAKYNVPIIAIRHGIVEVEAHSVEEAIRKGWDAISTQDVRWWLGPKMSVEEPYVPLTREDFE